jgi:hypothetical protein
MKTIRSGEAATVEGRNEGAHPDLRYRDEGEEGGGEAYRPAIMRLANGRYACIQAGDPLPRGARAVSRWDTNQWRAFD